MSITKPIVVGVDGSAPALDAVRWAAREALQRRLGLHVVHAWGMPGIHYGSGVPLPASVFDTLEQDATRVLGEAVETARSFAPKLSVTGEMPYEPPVPCLVERSRTAGMIVLGSSGRGGFVGMLAGSTAVGVSAHGRCPVAVIRGTEHDGPIVVGVDGSAVGEPAIALAFDEAAEHDAPLVAVHAWSDFEYDSFHGSPHYFGDTDTFAEEQQRLLAESLAGYQEKYPDVPVERVIVGDRPRHQLLLWSERARLVVVGSRGRGGFRDLLLGSTSQALIHHAKCPVLITRGG
ncbi:universal stress protein [Amycolatopsis taiwanensis]|uniref:Universal stress protein n=1 Tax=Amycolatopsis taiwanensis TaxID=342230 RepID=A0A9W6R5Q1_9PSEU|nr:universal stress protein [Amycolatopsis taiwanensis]GLY69926.1 universal stress protein [Amycolatopsis taiwanensis]